MSGETVLILGATSAIAERFARLRAADGDRLLLVGRDAGRLDAIATDLKARGADPATATLALDLAAPAEGFAAAFAAMTAALGGHVDVVLVAYGQLGDAAVTTADADPAAVVDLLTVNMTSACAWASVAAAHMERRGRGTIAAIGSVAGDRGRRSNYVYGAAKGGLALFMEGLAHRFAGTAVRVVTVKPGFVDTPMTAGMAKGGPLWATPDAVAADIDRAIAKGRPVLYTPWFWRIIMTIIRALPRPIFNRMKI
ncbi:SDR family oxidoreductase [Caenispirillum bisanense]|uniref:Short-chain dehydrogenase n=1 Tax=Caenispirillum bisanense TaxID=414052 RepID=A0A286GT43_9PROT|nr:SDR family oxidoreductase [Caenispirillum bisanense]SOD98731.1 Short-chain dehydrogenase [Caenispirillum bisanense]